jgi:hypothetical protein
VGGRQIPQCACPIWRGHVRCIGGERVDQHIRDGMV